MKGKAKCMDPETGGSGMVGTGRNSLVFVFILSVKQQVRSSADSEGKEYQMLGK